MLVVKRFSGHLMDATALLDQGRSRWMFTVRPGSTLPLGSILEIIHRSVKVGWCSQSQG